MKDDLQRLDGQNDNDLSTAKQHGEGKPDKKLPKDKEICLIFIVNGTPTKIEAKTNWPLKKAVEEVLKDSGNEGRLLSDWAVKWNGQVLEMDKKIEDFNFPQSECVELFLSLTAGQGGNKTS